jgi:hypothetical protein
MLQVRIFVDFYYLFDCLSEFECDRIARRESLVVGCCRCQVHIHRFMFFFFAVSAA